MERIIVYGLGRRFEIFWNWIKDEIKEKYEIVGITDRVKNSMWEQKDYFIERDSMNNINFDKIMITSDLYYQEISNELQQEYGIKKENIISMDEIIDGIYEKNFHLDYFSKKRGVEIGGPSDIFKKIYTVCTRCDGVNYDSETVWWNKKAEEYEYKGETLGSVIIADATDMSVIRNNQYDFCISSNNLEHIANPLKAMKEFVRITKKDGIVLILVPVKDMCFDHNREYTDFEHIIDDYKNNVLEDDLTHLDEILSKHDLSIDSGCKDWEEFYRRSLKNFENRCLHHHVFFEETLIKMYEYLELEVIHCHKIGYNYCILGRKRG